MGHYQFEAIHPFTDGNGRVFNILYLIQEELLNQPILYLSRHVFAHKADYYCLLLRVTRDKAWEPWLLALHAAGRGRNVQMDNGQDRRHPCAGRTHHQTRTHAFAQDLHS
ncbi:MAG: Fic family protein [Hydrogenophaga sp.]|nr:Fic family protein [Hydrogenophaga sp.]